MNPDQIDHLIAVRNRLTDVTAEYPDWYAVDHIDAVLADVSAGQRADVDKLLGRSCAIVEVLEAEAQRRDAEWQTEKNRRDWEAIKGDLAL